MSRRCFALGVLLVAACDSFSPITSNVREAPTGLELGERITVVLRSYSRSDSQKTVALDSKGLERSVESCIDRNILRQKGTPALVPTSDPSVRYRVDVDVHTKESPHYAGLGGIGATWTETTTMSATVFDTKYQRVSGWVSSSATGDEERGGFLVLFMVPIPYVYSSNTEKNACKAFSEELARFIIEERNR